MVMSLKKPRETEYRARAYDMVLSCGGRILEAYAVLWMVQTTFLISFF